jgi:hypothetical protein
VKRPAFQFYPADWRKDPALSSCSLAARGLWIELMCIAHESDRYGALSVNGRPMDSKQIARMVGEGPNVVVKLLGELEAAGVFSRAEDGAIYSRRMVKDEHIREVRAAAGKQGGNPNLLKHLDKQTDKQKPTPSSSSSSSSSSVDQDQNHDGPPLSGSTPGNGGGVPHGTSTLTGGHACAAMRRGGLPLSQAGNHADPRLLAAIEAGATAEQFEATAREGSSHDPPKGFGWIVQTVRGRITDARTAPAGVTHARSQPNPRVGLADRHPAPADDDRPVIEGKAVAVRA